MNDTMKREDVLDLALAKERLTRCTFEMRLAQNEAEKKRTEYMTLQQAHETLTARLRKDYDLSDSDEIDIATGNITRREKKE